MFGFIKRLFKKKTKIEVKEITEKKANIKVKKTKHERFGDYCNTCDCHILDCPIHRSNFK